MKLITANKLNRFFNRGVLPKLLEKLDKTKVLKTMEEVSANTNPENIPNALVVGELYNNLNAQPDFIYDSTGKITGYKTQAGADTVFPFSSGEVSFVSGSASASPVSISFTPSCNTSSVVIGGSRYGGVFTASIKDSSDNVIASALITATAAAENNTVEIVTLEKIACELKANETYYLYIPAQGVKLCSFAFVMYL